jgi:hypothetical protein
MYIKAGFSIYENCAMPKYSDFLCIDKELCTNIDLFWAKVFISLFFNFGGFALIIKEVNTYAQILKLFGHRL